MQKEQILSIAAKYRKLAASLESHDEEKAYKYDSFADDIEDNIDIYEDEYYQTEEDLLDDFNEAQAEIDYQWKTMFPDGDNDDAITDFLTN
ncbi:MAG: hypothetical protein LBR10_13015 [Prevotellaceae bacterium]|nr:hypothetical protein [Prevotellaceae bacterium]